MLVIQLAVVVALAAAGKECAECKPGALCKPHAEEESRVLAECRPRFDSRQGRKPTAAESQSAIEKLQRIAALDLSHSNAPSAAVVDALAAGVHDLDPKVSREAVRLLYESGNRDAVVVATTRLIDTTIDVLTHPPRIPAKALDKRLHPDGPALSEQDLDKIYRFTAVFEIAPDVLASSGKLRDDRIVASVRKLVVAQVNAKYDVCVAGPVALVELGTRDAIGTALTALDAYERAGRSAKPGKSVLPDPAQGKILHDRLVELSTSNSLTGAPEWGPGATAKWRKWLDANQASLPESLGKLPATPSTAGQRQD